MNKETIEQIGNYLDKIGEKLGVGAQKVWPWFVREQYVQAWFGVITFTLAAVVFVIALGKVKDKELDTWDPTVRDGVIIAIGFVCIVFMGVGLLQMLTELPDLFNPEYHALTDILKRVKP